MNIAELKRKLEQEGINPNAYSICSGEKDEAYVLERNDSFRWLVYYSERGLKSGLKEFATEEQACSAFLERILRDPLTKQ